MVLLNCKTALLEELFELSGSFSPITGAIEADGELRYAEKNGLRLECDMRDVYNGIVRRRDKIKNISDAAVRISSAFSRFTFSGGEYEVYTQYGEWCCESEGRWQRLNTGISLGNEDMRMSCGSVPFVAIYNEQNRRGVAFHLLADCAWDIRVKKRIKQRNGWTKEVTVELGIREKGFNCELAPEESLELPEVLCYEFCDKRDMEAFRLHQYYNEVYPARSLPIVYDSWLSKFDTVSYELLYEQLERAKYLGIEYFVIDAGWFGDANKWYDSVGDWREATDVSMKGRMKEFADAVREKGLKFGLWFEIERASLRSEAYKSHPEYYIVEGNNAFVNFASEAACDYIFGVISDQIRKYGIEFIKFDYNADLTYDPEELSFINFFRGYNGFIDRLRREFPSLYLENCASGGLRMALGALSGFDSFWMSDNHSLYEQLRIFKDTILRMPSRALERWITVTSAEVKAPGYSGSSPTDKILVSGDCGWGHIEAVNADYLKACTVGGPIGLTCDLAELSEGTLRLLKEHIEAYKSEREFWMRSECHILADTETVLALEFTDKERNTIKIYAYAAIPHQNEITVYPRVRFRKLYEDGNGNSIEGSEILEKGITLPIKDRYTASFAELKAVGECRFTV